LSTRIVDFENQGQICHVVFSNLIPAVTAKPLSIRRFSPIAVGIVGVKVFPRNTATTRTAVDASVTGGVWVIDLGEEVALGLRRILSNLLLVELLASREKWVTYRHDESCKIPLGCGLSTYPSGKI